MSHVLPPASESVLQGQKFYRIVDEDPRPGALIPVDASATAIVVGPDSDFAQYEIYYLDVLAPNGIRRATISVDRPWLATTFVDLTPASGFSSPIPGKPSIPGQIYVIPADIFGDTDPQFESSPTIDLIVYTGALPAQLPNRARKSRRGSLPFNVGQNFFNFPAYGRRYFDIEIAIQEFVGSFDFEVNGGTVILPYNESEGSQFSNITNLVPSTTLDSAGTRVFKFLYDALKPDGSGRFDVVQIFVENATAQNLAGQPLGGVTLKLELGD